MYVLYHAWVKYRYVKLFQSTFIESSQHMLERVMTTRLSRNESSTFCTSTSISFTPGKQYTPHPLPLMTRLAQVESSVILHNSNRCGCIGHGWGIRDIFGIDLREQGISLLLKGTLTKILREQWNILNGSGTKGKSDIFKGSKEHAAPWEVTNTKIIIIVIMITSPYLVSTS